MGSYKSKHKCKSKCNSNCKINHHIIYILDYYPQYQNEFQGIYNNINQNKSNCQSYLSNCQFYHDQGFMNKLGVDLPTLLQMINSTSWSSDCSRSINCSRKCNKKCKICKCNCKRCQIFLLINEPNNFCISLIKNWLLH